MFGVIHPAWSFGCFTFRNPSPHVYFQCMPLLGTSARARGGEDVAWRSSTSSLPELRQSSFTSCISFSSVSSSDKAVVAGSHETARHSFPLMRPFCFSPFTADLFCLCAFAADFLLCLAFYSANHPRRSRTVHVYFCELIRAVTTAPTVISSASARMCFMFMP